MMLRKKGLTFSIILLGGIAVVGSYVIGALSYANAGQALWGGVPESWRPFITANMFLAAFGYFIFTYFILLRLDAEKTRIGRFGFGLFNVLYLGILIPSALWLPFTFQAVERSSQAWLWAVMLVLWLTALSSLGILWALVRVQPVQSPRLQRLSVIGALFFCLQTVVLDAIFWVVYFEV